MNQHKIKFTIFLKAIIVKLHNWFLFLLLLLHRRRKIKRPHPINLDSCWCARVFEWESQSLDENFNFDLKWEKWSPAWKLFLLAFFAQTTTTVCKKNFEKNANFFNENRQKSQKIVIITSTPAWKLFSHWWSSKRHRVKKAFFGLRSLRGQCCNQHFRWYGSFFSQQLDNFLENQSDE
jgi:hypothetical protein